MLSTVAVSASAREARIPSRATSYIGRRLENGDFHFGRKRKDRLENGTARFRVVSGAIRLVLLEDG